MSGNKVLLRTEDGKKVYVLTGSDKKEFTIVDESVKPPKVESFDLVPPGKMDNIDARIDDLTSQIASLTQDTAAHLADNANAHNINTRALKSDLNNMTVKAIEVPTASSVTVTFSKEAGHFMILARTQVLADAVGAYVASTYTWTADRWNIGILKAASNLTITTGANTLTFANAHATTAMLVEIISFNDTTMTVSS